jgi:hypothetical protein
VTFPQPTIRDGKTWRFLTHQPSSKLYAGLRDYILCSFTLLCRWNGHRYLSAFIYVLRLEPRILIVLSRGFMDKREPHRSRIPRIAEAETNNPGESYGLACLQKLASKGRHQRVRIVGILSRPAFIVTYVYSARTTGPRPSRRSTSRSRTDPAGSPREWALHEAEPIAALGITEEPHRTRLVRTVPWISNETSSALTPRRTKRAGRRRACRHSRWNFGQGHMKNDCHQAQTCRHHP